jgi:hypothetical protein
MSVSRKFDEYLMRLALRGAEKAAEKGEVPVVVLCGKTELAPPVGEDLFIDTTQIGSSRRVVQPPDR